jgi:hypothetical protein
MLQCDGQLTEDAALAGPHEAGMHNTFPSRIQSSGLRRPATTAAVTLLAAALLTACGGGKGEEEVAQAAQDPAAAAAAAPVAAAPPAVDPAKARLASAVADGKTSAPVDMKYDMLAKPALGQPFEVELVFDPRRAADTLEIEITDAPGLVLVGEKTAKFGPVEAGQSYTAKVLVKGDSAGLYYIGVLAKMSTQVQTESRAFAVPVVIGDPAAGQKPAAAAVLDSEGQAVQPMKAEEPK